MEYKIVKFRKKHIPTLKEICSRVNKFPCPEFTDSSFIVRTSVQDRNDKVVAGGFLKLVPEAIVILEPSLPVKDRVKIVTAMFDVARSAAEHIGFNTLHAFVEDNSFKNFLIKKFGFHAIDGNAISTTFRY